MVKKYRNFGVKHMFVSGQVYTNEIKIKIFEDIQM